MKLAGHSAWTGRILFRLSSEIRVLEYSNVSEALHSDHRQVFGFGVFRVNMEGRQLLATGCFEKETQSQVCPLSINMEPIRKKLPVDPFEVQTN
jgi:hypothetical protein